ncbi:MAG: PepSY1/2 domain-containing protein [Bacillota bacterium]
MDMDNKNILHSEEEERRKEKRDKRRRILTGIVVPVVLGAALIVVSFWGASQASKADQYRLNTENMYRRCYYELADNLSTMQVTLEKLMVVNSPPQYVVLLDDLWRASGASEGLMSQIPSSHPDTKELTSFITQVGDYAHTLTKQVLAGRMVGEEDVAKLEELQQACAKISKEFRDRIDSGNLALEALTADGYYASEVGTGDAAQNAPTGEQTGEQTGAPSPGQEGQSGSPLPSAEGQQSDEGSESTQAGGEDGENKYPTLIYDGPFSESTQKVEPKGVTGKEIDGNKAQQIAQELLGEGATVQSAGESNGNIPTFEFAGKYSDGREADISITKVGGCVLNFMASATGSEEGKASKEQTESFRKAGDEFLKKLGYKNMISTYAQFYAGAAVINFAAKQGDVILYSDLVKVWVDRATATVIGIDARNYLMSHRERQIDTDVVSKEEAQSMVSSRIKVESVALALIPITAKTEKLCYEFKGTYKDTSYIVYVNAKTLEEEQIFKIIDSENGQLVV